MAVEGGSLELREVRRAVWAVSCRETRGEDIRRLLGAEKKVKEKMRETWGAQWRLQAPPFIWPRTVRLSLMSPEQDKKICGGLKCWLLAFVPITVP